MLTHADAGPNYVKFMDEYCLKHAEGYFLDAKEMTVLLRIEQIYLLLEIKSLVMKMKGTYFKPMRCFVNSGVCLQISS